MTLKDITNLILKWLEIEPIPPKPAPAKVIPIRKAPMIAMSELLSGKNLEDQSDEIQAALQELLEKINQIRSLWGRSMTVTSGLRTMEDHLRIYREKAEKAGVPFDQSKVPMKSKHLFGQAVDISDPNKQLQQWCKANEHLIKDAGLWCEDFSSTPNWVHFQIVPYGSYVEGKSIWFIP